MALRDQPYLPLYIQDFLTDEKLIECSAESTGVYIRLMCIMHKSENYGKILLKQKHKQTSEQIKNFALMIAKQMPYDVNVIYLSLRELLDEKVLHIDGDSLVQQRMVKDGEISDKRAFSGTKGGKKTQLKTKEIASQFAKAKNEANYEYENENENVDEVVFNDVVVKEKKTRKKFIIPSLDEIRDFAEKEMIGSRETPDDFRNHYEANGWMMNKVPMKNWQAAFRNWAKREKNGTYQRPISGQFTGKTKSELEWERFKAAGTDPDKGRRELAELLGFPTD